MSKRTDEQKEYAAYTAYGAACQVARLMHMRHVQLAGERYEQCIRQYRQDYERATADANRLLAGLEKLAQEQLSSKLSDLDIPQRKV